MKRLCRGFFRFVAENQENDAQQLNTATVVPAMSAEGETVAKTFVRRDPCRAAQLFRLPWKSRRRFLGVSRCSAGPIGMARDRHFTGLWP
jgi:hypothetical protein